jgi:hypothetical protein
MPRRPLQSAAGAPFALAFLEKIDPERAGRRYAPCVLKVIPNLNPDAAPRSLEELTPGEIRCPNYGLWRPFCQVYTPKDARPGAEGLFLASLP